MLIHSIFGSGKSYGCHCKAFDMLPPNFLTSKLQTKGFCGEGIDWQLHPTVAMRVVRHWKMLPAQGSCGYPMHGSVPSQVGVGVWTIRSSESCLFIAGQWDYTSFSGPFQPKRFHDLMILCLRHMPFEEKKDLGEGCLWIIRLQAYATFFISVTSMSATGNMMIPSY